jgi:threonyl-tRNA synthetase
MLILVIQQVEDEVGRIFDFLEHVYSLFGFTFKLELSTRPEKRLGDDKTWDQAEAVSKGAFVQGETAYLCVAFRC